MSGIGGELGARLGQAAAQKAIGVALDRAFDLSGTGAIKVTLDEIVTAIRQVQAQINAFRSEMEKMLSQMSYDLAMTSVQPLIDRNQVLAELHSALATATANQAQGIRQDINQLIDASFLIGLKT